jgi:hypothetical protein
MLQSGHVPVKAQNLVGDDIVPAENSNAETAVDQPDLSRQIEALHALIANNERRHDEVRAFNRERQLEKERTLDLRLDAMNKFREAMQDQASRFIQRSEFEASKATSMERYESSRQNFDLRLENELAPLHAAVDSMGKPNWPVMASAGSILIAACAGVWLVLGLKIDNTVAPMQLVLESVRAASAATAERVHFIEGEAAASTQADTASRTDRAQIQERLHQLEGVLPVGATAAADVASLKTLAAQMADRIQTMRTDVAKQGAALVEIETQFCAADTVRNLMHANDLRVESMLWQKAFDGQSQYPIVNAFYPRIGRCQNGGTVDGH